MIYKDRQRSTLTPVFFSIAPVAQYTFCDSTIAPQENRGIHRLYGQI